MNRQSMWSARLRRVTVGLGVLGLVVAGFGTAVAVHATTSSPASAPVTLPVPFDQICGPNGWLASVGYKCVPITTVPSAAGTLNSVATIQYDMDGPHEAAPAGVPTDWSWAQHPVVDNAVPPSDCTSLTAWGTVYAVAGATEPTGVRVELKDIESYVFLKSQDKWVRAQASVQVTGWHDANDFSNSGLAVNWNSEPDGGISADLVSGHNVEFYPTGARGTIDPSDVAGAYTTVQARLIGPDAATAQYLANMGGDWWQNATVGYGDGSHNPGIGQGRFVRLGTNWQAVSFYSGGGYGPAAYPPGWGAAQLAASNPPLDGMGLP